MKAKYYLKFAIGISFDSLDPRIYYILCKNLIIPIKIVYESYSIINIIVVVVTVITFLITVFIISCFNF
jgi:hypothetical protein